MTFDSCCDTNKGGANLSYTGRYYAESDNRWQTDGDPYGVNSPNFSTNGGTGSDPTFPGSATGHTLFAGDSISKWAIRIEATSPSEVTGAEIAIMFRDFSDNETIIHRATISGLTTLKIDNRLFESFTKFTATEAGDLIVLVRPIGTVTSTSYIYASINVS